MPHELPPTLQTPFSVRAALQAGVTPKRLRGRDLDTPFWGARSIPIPARSDLPSEAVVNAALEYRPVMAANQFFSHVTAAALWGLPIPPHVLRAAVRNGPDVAVFGPARHPRRHGIRGHEVHPASAYIVEHPGHGLRLTSPASTWAALGATLRDPYDLIAVGDAAVRERMFRDDTPPLATLEHLTAAAAVPRRVGAAALRAALPRIRTRSASPRETRCRLLLIDAGLPEPALNHEVRDHTGRVIACVDLAYPEARVAIEYEGEHHLFTREQWARDLARYEALAAAGWFVVRVSAAHLEDGDAALAARVRAALTR
ncbi:hypothetical protein HDC37_003239 [Microbacterium sp. AK009]|uniref:endonuclease domain-containing protein n=1 Tax=Microbacterium sp. AK009 TaxID=2723068 RepID=UPI0015CDAEA7|nr:hypothetical protein [Microbacterium sp. AK009]NYF18379.1 hypothetical protein [Microbacterium sp. AK009]